MGIIKKFYKINITLIVDLYRFIKNIPRAVKLVFFIYFFQGVIHNLGHPVTPAFVDGLGINDFYFGMFFSAMALGLLVGGPIWGYLGDRGNKRLYIVLGLLVYSLGQYLFASSTNQYMMLLWRFMSGFGVSSSVTLLMSHLLEHSEEENRTVYLGWYQAIFVVGSSVGYIISGQLTEIQVIIDVLHTDQYENIFYIQAIWNIFHAVVIFFVIGKSVKLAKETIGKANIFKAFTDIKKLDPTLILFLISLAFISIGAISVSKFIEKIMFELTYTEEQIGNFVGITGFVSLGATIFLVPIVAKIKKDFPFMVFIQFFSAVIIFIVFRQNDLLVALYTGFMLYVILKAIYTPLEQHYISSHAPKGKYGTIMGVRQMFFAIGLVIGPLIGGALFDLKPIYVFDFSAVMFLIGVILLLIVGKQIKRLEIDNNG